MTGPPLVSICMPAFNAERWIADAVESALAQTYGTLELIIADNASTDATLDIVRSYDDSRIRIETAISTISAGANHNRAVRASRGSFIKFLHADDLLAPSCVEEMVALALEDPSIGLVFAPREVLAESAPDPGWLERYARPHEGFGALSAVNDGRALFRRLLAADFEENWVGEPSAVLVRRAALERVGLLNERIHQLSDLELWARIMLRYRIGFIDSVLSVYRHHGASGTAANARALRDWFDLPWLVEGLLASGELRPDERSSLLRLRRRLLRLALRRQLGRLVRGVVSAELPAYASYRVRTKLGRRPSPTHLVELQ